LPEAYVVRVTEAKLDAALLRLAARGLPAAPVLCSDTTVALDQLILGKPVDAEDAFATLSLLSGRRHRVITAVAVGTPDRRSSVLNISEVEFAPVPAEQLRRYVASGEPFGKAGSYAIQSQAAAWIRSIHGSYSAIMGLPLYETAQLLQSWGFRF
jgi:septum formation protein